MLAAIEFHDQFVRARCKVANVGSDGHLAVETDALQLAIAEVAPELFLCVGGIGAKLAGTHCGGSVIGFVQQALPFAASQLFPSRSGGRGVIKPAPP